MSNVSNATSNDLPKLPVVLTARAWQEAVHIEKPLYLAEISERLGNVVLTTYRELQFQPEQSRIEFGLYRFPPDGSRLDRVWLELTLHQIECESCGPYLCVSLRDEQPTIHR